MDADNLNTTYDIRITANDKTIVAKSEVCCIEADLWRNLFLRDWTIRQWEDRYPIIAKRSTTEMCMTIFDNNRGDEDKEEYLRTWTWARGSDYESVDGWGTSYRITNYPICFIPEFEDLVYGLVKDSGMVEWYAFHFKNPMRTPIALRLNINSAIDLLGQVANIRFKNGELNWGFEGVNGVLRFREQCEKHKTCTSVTPNASLKDYLGEDAYDPEKFTYIPIHYNLGIGAWFEDNLTLSTLQKYICDDIKVGESKCEAINGSMVLNQ